MGLLGRDRFLAGRGGTQGTPAPTVTVFEQAVLNAMKNAEICKNLIAIGIDPADLTGAHYRKALGGRLRDHGQIDQRRKSAAGELNVRRGLRDRHNLTYLPVCKIVVSPPFAFSELR